MQEIVIKSLRWSKKRQIFNQNFHNQFLYVVELMRYRATSNLDLLQFMRQKMIILRSRLGVEEFLTTEIIMNDNWCSGNSTCVWAFYVPELAKNFFVWGGWGGGLVGDWKFLVDSDRKLNELWRYRRIVKDKSCILLPVIL